MIQNHLYKHESEMCGKESNERQPASYCYKKGLVRSQDNVHRTLHFTNEWPWLPELFIQKVVLQKCVATVYGM